MHGEVYDRVVLPTDVPSNRSVWEKVLDLQPKYHPVKRRIRFLVEKGLTSTMVLHDFVSKHITLFQYRAQPAWLYIGPNDTTCLERGNRSDLEPDMLAATLSKATAKNRDVDADATKKAAVVKATAKKATADRATADKAATDKVAANKVVADRATADKAVTNESGPEEAAAKKTAVEKSVVELAGPGPLLPWRQDPRGLPH
jgi:hypothetical protein